MIIEAAKTFVSTRWRSRHGQNRQHFETWQARQLAKWLAVSVPKVAAYHGFAKELNDLPIIDKAILMADFDQYNVPRITAKRAWQTLADGDQIDDMIVGASTGTSGNRGLFVITQNEQFRWLGTILAKTMADMLWQPQRVAIILPRNTSLYDSANRTRHLNLRFFDISQGIEAWIDDLCAFDPTVIVAPPRILRHLAEIDAPLSPKRIFSAAETLDAIDETVITNRFGGPLRQIYMATEGLFAVSCHLGNLHLAEDSVFFELEPVGDGLVSPIVTCFRRDTQIMARYRMNDLLRLAPAPCACGSPLTTISEIVGRMDDTFEFNGVLVTPDVMRDAVLQAHPDITDFRVVQTGETTVSLSLPMTCQEDAFVQASQALQDVFTKRRTPATVTAKRTQLDIDTAQKLRRVRKDWP